MKFLDFYKIYFMVCSIWYFFHFVPWYFSLFIFGMYVDKLVLLFVIYLILLFTINQIIPLKFLFVLLVPIIILYTYRKIRPDLLFIIFLEIMYTYIRWSESIHTELITLNILMMSGYIVVQYGKKRTQMNCVMELTNICSNIGAKPIICVMPNNNRQHLGIQFNHMSYPYYEIDIYYEILPHFLLYRNKSNNKSEFIKYVPFETIFPLSLIYYGLNLFELNRIIYSDTKYILSHMTNDHMQIIINMYLTKYTILRGILQKDICVNLFMKCLTNQFYC
jgi:hypothetical protein